MEKICSGCTELTLAQSLCTMCNKWLCYRCTDVHQHQRASSLYTDLFQQQQQRPTASQCPDLHQRNTSVLPPPGQGPGSHPCSRLMCQTHRQEPLELFCESCDLLCCSSCHLSSHKNHRVVQIGKALQDQQWLFENLMMQVEERRSSVENSAKQIEDRLHGVKIAHRKAENQIKMAKMIMMNELNKRANLLIEQVEKISEEFQQRLEDQLQGAIEICGQLDHIQKFITWATTHHCRGPVLFSRALISLQMQRLLESSLHADTWSPVKIKFNWDASYWTKQISSFGQLTVDGGSCIYPSGLPCSSILRPQPIACLTLPPMFHRVREPGCGYQACCEPQICCLHGIPPQQELAALDKGQIENLYNSSCIQPAHFSASLHQSQQLHRFWETENSPQCPPTSPGSIQLNCSQGSASQDPQSLTYASCHQLQREISPNSQTLLSVFRGGESQCKAKLATSPALQEVNHNVRDQDLITEECREQRYRKEKPCGQTSEEESRGLQNEELEGNRSPTQQQLQSCFAVDQQRTRPAFTLRAHKGGKRSTSLEVSAGAHMYASDVQSSRLSPSLVCVAGKRRSRSIPTELAAPATSPHSGVPASGCRNNRETGTPKYDIIDLKQRRDSDGGSCIVNETDSTQSRGLSPSLPYKTEPDHSTAFVYEEVDFGAKGTHRLPRNNITSNEDAPKGSARSRVPVVCLERLKILVAQLPPHGRRQSDPLPASETDKSEGLPHHSTWHTAMQYGTSRGSDAIRTSRSLTDDLAHSLSSSYSDNWDFSSDKSRRLSSHTVSTQLPPDTIDIPESYSVLDLDSNSDPRSVLEDVICYPTDPDPPLNSDGSLSSDPNEASSTEADIELVAGRESAGSSEVTQCGDSEASLEYEAEPDADAGAGSDDCQVLDADAESVKAERDTQPEYDHSVQAETDSICGQPAYSQGSVASESDPEPTADDPQPLCSDLEEEPQMGPGLRQLLIANPAPQRYTEDILTEQDADEMESEDFCAVCLIGGELLCCDRCPKVFHLSCHVPPVLSFPTGDWVCSVCRDILQPEVEYDCENERSSGAKAAHGLSAGDQRKCERLALLILSNILSAPFQEPVSPLARHYYQIIKRPMDLSVIRTRLNKGSARHYSSPDQFVADVYLMFRNCAKFNYPDSEMAQAGRSLEAFFVSKLKEVFPDRDFPMAEVDSDSDEYDEACRAANGSFLWPERREQCYRKRKRRQSLKSRRHHF